MNELQNNYEKSCNDYIKAFCKKQDMDFEFWSGNLIGATCFIGDYYFNFQDIVWDVNSNQEKGLILEWYDDFTDNPETAINYYNYTKLDNNPYK